MQKLIAVLFVSCLLICGCGESNQELADEQAENQDLQTQQSADPLADVKRFSELAKQQEENRQYGKAAVIWGQVAQLAADQFGADAWQTRNAKLAHDRAFRKSQLTGNDLQILDDAERLLSQVRQNYQAGQLESAMANSRAAADRYAHLFGRDSVEVAQLLVQSGTFAAGMNRSDEALKQFHQGIELLKQNEFYDHPELQIAHSGLAMLYSQKGSLGPAISNQKEAARIAGIVHGVGSTTFATQAHQLGTFYHQAGNHEVAFQVLDEAKLIRQKLLGDDDPAFAHSCMNLGIVCMDLKRYEDAAEYFTTASPIFLSSEGDSGPSLLRCRSHLATIYMLQQKPSLAEPLLTSVVNVLQSQAAPEARLELLDHRYRLAIALARQGKYNLAKPMFEGVIQNQKESFGLSDKRTVTSLRAYALLLERTNHADAAAKVRRQINQVAHLTDDDDFQPNYK